MALPARPKADKPVTCRMFDTPVIERFSRIHPISPFVFWIPVILLLLAGVVYQGMAWYLVISLMMVGWLAWSLAEYMLHRFVFHFLRPKTWVRRFHFNFHGVHHDFPQDVKRLVMPLGVSIPLGLAFFLAMHAIAPLPMAMAAFAGFVAGYLAYDGVHYFTHHMPARSRVGKFLKRYHMVHHHTGVDGLYGVSQPLWDYLLGTQHDLRAKKKQPAKQRAVAS